MKIKYYVSMPSELTVGLRGFTDTVTVTVASGDPGGTLGDFTEHIRLALAAWYDAARITCEVIR